MRIAFVLMLVACGGRLDGAPDSSALPDGGVVARDAGGPLIPPSIDAGTPPSTDAAVDAATTACPGIVDLAINQQPMHMVIDDLYVYWTNETHVIRRVAKKGGKVDDVISFPSNGWSGGWGMAVDDTHAYAGETTLVRGPKSGGMATPVTSEGHFAYGIAIDANNLYWAGDGGVYEAPKAGGSATLLASVTGAVMRVAAGGGNVFYTTWDPGGLWRVPASGGTAVQLDVMIYSDYLALDQTDVYFTNVSSSYGPGHVRRVSQQGGSATTLYTTQSEPSGVALDATHVYWGDYDGGIQKIPKTGGTATAVVPKKYVARAVAVDDDCVYWIQNDRVSAAPK